MIYGFLILIITFSMQSSIKLYGVRTHNLKNIDVEIPKNKITVISGVSGSGKSTLAFSTIYKEGQFRYIESLSTYLRGFFNLGDRAELDYSEGLSPAIAIEQNKKGGNKRSTVGTMTETDDYLRLAFAKLGDIYCYNCGNHIHSQTIDQIIDGIFDLYGKTDSHHELFSGTGDDEINLAGQNKSLKGQKSPTKIWILSDKQVFDDPKKLNKYFRANQRKVDKGTGFTQILVKGKDFNSVYFYLEEPSFLKENMPVEVYGIYDKITIKEGIKHRLQEDLIKLFSTNEQIYTCKFTDKIDSNLDLKSWTIFVYCSNCNIHFPEYTPAHFSPNRIEGACSECNGTGETLQVDLDKIIDENQPVKNAILPWRDSTIGQKILTKLSMMYEFNLDVKWKNLEKEYKDIIINGDNELLKLNMGGKFVSLHYNGIESIIKEQYEKGMLTRDFQAMVDFNTCPKCKGKKLNNFALSVKLGGQVSSHPELVSGSKNNKKRENLEIKDSETSSEGQIFNYDITYYQNLTIGNLIKELKKLKISKEKEILTKRIIGPLLDKLETINNLGLDYLTLSRGVNTLSGGEIQRLRLAKQLGNKLSGIIYVLDEPTIGLDTGESIKTIKAIKELKKLGNTIIVVEHNEDFIKNADYIIEIGPGAGDFGGNVVFSGTIDKFLKSNTLTAEYITGKKEIQAEFDHKPIKKYLEVKKAHKHNLKNIDIKIPLGGFTIITGASGAGKTTILYDTIFKFFKDRESITQAYIRTHLMKKGYSWTEIMSKQLINPLDYAKFEKEALTDFFHNKLEIDTIQGYKDIKNYVYIDQSAIGKNPRSCPSTFIGVWDDIRQIFANTQEAKMYGLNSSYFSFNSSKGACQECKGYGYKKIELQFLPDTYVECELCHGKRFRPEVLNITWNGKTVSDILNMYISSALEFFDAIPVIKEKLQLLEDIGLGYLKMGQPAHTLSGGESQRLKLVKNLLKKYKGHTIYFLDEPTVGLHFVDIEKLLKILGRFLNRQETIVMIEHDKNLLKFADKVIDMQNGEIVE